MTATEVYSTALKLLGYSDCEAFSKRAIAIINQVYLDLYEMIDDLSQFIAIRSMSEEINLPERVIRKAMIFGVAEQLALGCGDGELQQYYSIKYDAARRGINRVTNIYDNMP